MYATLKLYALILLIQLFSHWYITIWALTRAQSCHWASGQRERGWAHDVRRGLLLGRGGGEGCHSTASGTTPPPAQGSAPPVAPALFPASCSCKHIKGHCQLSADTNAQGYYKKQNFNARLIFYGFLGRKKNEINS